MHSFQFIKTFFTNPKLSRLRVFIMWSLLCSAPTLFIILVTLQSQTYVPGIGTGVGQYFISMASGIFVVPLLFTFTNGLRGYHVLFSKLLGSLGNLFVPKSQDEVEEEIGLLNVPEKVMQMEQTATILGFLTLEFIIIGWDVVVYILFNSMSSLSLLGFMSDNLMIGLLIFILEALNVVVVGSKSFLQLHTLKATTILKHKETK